MNGIRNFPRINASFASLTGQSRGVAAATFAEIEEQLPPDYDVRSFVTSQQVAISKIALDYCDALVDGPGRDTFFPGFDFTATPDRGVRDRRMQRDLRLQPAVRSDGGRRAGDAADARRGARGARRDDRPAARGVRDAGRLRRAAHRRDREGRVRGRARQRRRDAALSKAQPGDE